MPEGAIYVGRPSKWGNPFVVHAGNADRAVQTFRKVILDSQLPILADIRRELRGHDLACWCPLDRPCHADVLLEIANA